MFDILTVVYEAELPLLKIQAHAIQKYCTLSEIRHIRVMVNDGNINVARSINRKWWGSFKNKVIITPRSKMFVPHELCRGWITQQLCKLMGAAESKSDWVMILDAKTWFFRPVSEKMLFKDGRPMVIVLAPNPRFLKGRQILEAEHDVDMSYAIGPLGVPYWFHVPTVQGIIAEHEDFPSYFMKVGDHPTFVSEFLLYACAIIKNNLFDKLYYKKLAWAPWHIGEGDEGTFDQSFDNLINNPLTMTTSIHRNCFNTLTTEQLARWVNFLHQEGVIIDVAEFEQLIAHYREIPLVRGVQR
jgi:hypothetical protein